MMMMIVALVALAEVHYETRPTGRTGYVLLPPLLLVPVSVAVRESIGPEAYDDGPTAAASCFRQPWVCGCCIWLS